MSPFSTAIKTDLRCSTSVLCRCILSPKSSIVADSERNVIRLCRGYVMIEIYQKEQWRPHPVLPAFACCSSPWVRIASPGSLGRGRPVVTSGSSRSPRPEAAWLRCTASRPHHSRQNSQPRRHTDTEARGQKITSSSDKSFITWIAMHLSSSGHRKGSNAGQT